MLCRRTFAIALLFVLIFLAQICLAGPESPVSGSESVPAPFAANLILFQKIVQTLWDTIGLILLQKLICLFLILPFLPERSSATISLLPGIRPGSSSTSFEPVFAGPFSRLCAAFIDSLIFVVPCAVLGLLVFFATALVIDPFQVFLIQISTNFAFILMPASLAALFESSRLQATPGKKLFRIRVTDSDGNRCSFARALARNLAFAVSDLTLGVGFVACLWTKRRQCFHDQISNCVLTKAL